MTIFYTFPRHTDDTKRFQKKPMNLLRVWNSSFLIASRIVSSVHFFLNSLTNNTLLKSQVDVPHGRRLIVFQFKLTHEIYNSFFYSKLIRAHEINTKYRFYYENIASIE